MAAILNIALNTVFIPRNGFIAAAVTTLIGFMSLCILHILLVRKIGYGDLLDMKYSIRFLALASCLAGFIIVLYNYHWLRYSVVGVSLVCIATFFCLNIDKVKRVIKERNIELLFFEFNVCSKWKD